MPEGLRLSTALFEEKENPESIVTWKMVQGVKEY
jgi:hypothetical protein